MKSFMKKIVFLFAVFFLALLVMPKTTSRAATVTVTGTSNDLTFTIDDEGTLTITGSGVPGNSIPKWNDYAGKIKKAIVKVGKVTTLEDFFYGLNNLESVEFQSIDMSLVESTDCMFGGCTKLKSVDLSKIDFSGVKNMSYMFYACTSLTDISLKGWDTANVEDMSYMFYACEKATNIDLKGLNTEKLTNMRAMFKGCVSLPGIDLSSFNTQNVTDMWNMFGDCHKLQEVNLSSFRTPALTSMAAMFYNCYVLKSVDLSNFDTSQVSGFDYLFYCCYALESVNLKGINTKNVNNMSYMFYFCNKLGVVDLSSFDTSAVTDISNMFYACDLIYTEISIHGNITSYENCFKGACDAGGNLSLGLINCPTDLAEAVLATKSESSDIRFTKDRNFQGKGQYNTIYWHLEGDGTLFIYGYGAFTKTGETFPVWYSYADKVKKAVISCGKLDTTAYMFCNHKNLKTVEIVRIDTSEATDMRSMFSGCTSLVSADLKLMKTPAVKDMSEMFSECESLSSVNIKSFSGKSLETCTRMFFGCSSLTTVDLAVLASAAKLTDMSYMFRYCSSLKKFVYYSGDGGGKSLKTMKAAFADCSSLETMSFAIFSGSSLTDMSMLFLNCSSLWWANMTGFDTSKVTSMAYMFSGCSSLNDLEFNLDTSSVTNMAEMFKGCSSLTEIGPVSLDTSSVTNIQSMFKDCGKLSLNFTLSNNLASSAYGSCFANAATEEGAEIIIYYDGKCTYDIAKAVKDTKSSNSNVNLQADIDASTPPPQTDIKSVVNAVNGLKLTWNASEGAAYYVIYRQNANGDFVAYDKTTATSYVDTNVEAGRWYSYQLTAANQAGTECGNCMGVGCRYIPAVTSSNLKISNTVNGVKLSWPDIGYVHGINIYRKTGTGSYKKIDVIGYDNTSYVDATAVSGTTYTYAVRGYYGDTLAAYSGKSILCLDPIVSSQLTVANTIGGAKVTWPKVTGAGGYYVYRKTGSGSYAKIATVSASTTSYTDATPKSGTTYGYCVRAYQGSTMGSYSGKNILYLSPLIAKDLTLSNTSTGIKVTWTKVTGAKGYYVYRKSGSGDYKMIKTISDGATLTYTDTSIAANNGTAYTYCVRAYNGSTKGSYAGKSIYRLSGTSFSSISNVSGKKIALKWTANTKATGYQIQYSTSSTFASGNTTLTVAGASVVSKTTAALTLNSTYYVRIRVYKTNSSGTSYYSAWSAVKSVKITK